MLRKQKPHRNISNASSSQLKENLVDYQIIKTTAQEKGTSARDVDNLERRISTEEAKKLDEPTQKNNL